ncbi:MAG: 30S ribosomal protein S4e [Candidatus Nanoarchaeia archaeon]
MSKQKHLSRLAAPKTWPIARKKAKWIAKPIPATHSMQYSMPLQIYLIDILHLAKSKAEVKRILNQNLVLVNGKVRKEARFPVGLFDTLKILKYNKYYRVVLDNKGQLKLIEIPHTETDLIITKVEGKHTIKGGKMQIHVSNGWNFIADKDIYKIGDCVLFDAKEGKPIKHIALEPGCIAYVIGGAHAGKVVTISDFVEEGILRKKRYAITIIDEKKLKIPLKELFVIGKNAAEITLP